MSAKQQLEDLSQYLDWRELPRRYPNLVTQNQMRHLVQSRHFNGLGAACHKIHARKILVNVPEFIRWIKNRR